jgi:hypothetical protein
MADVVADLGANYANLRYRHPFVTEGLNKKVVGMPSGILQGGKLTAAVGNQSVVVNTDPDTGLSVYNYERRSSPLSAVTVIEEENRTIDLSAQAGTTVYVCLYVEYTITTTTLVQFRTYSESELFGASPVTEAGDVVILGKVDVPATAIPIPDEDVVGDHRTDAWQRRSAGSRDWLQIFRNGSGAIPYIAVEPVVPPPFFYAQTVYADSWELIYSAAYKRSMLQSLRCNISGSGAVILFTPATCLNSSHASPVFTPIRAGSRIMFSFYKRAASWTGDSAGYIHFVFRPAPDGNDGSDVLVQHEFSAGTTDSDWVHVTGIVEAPSDCWFFYGFGLTSSGTNIGYIYFDDIRVWVEAGNALEDEGAAGLIGINSPVSGSALVLFPANTVDDSDEFVEGAIELSGSYDGSTPSIDLLWLKIGGTTNPFDFNVYADLNLNGNLNFPANSAPTVPRILLDQDLSTTKVLFAQCSDNASSERNLRVYVDEAELMLTHGAVWSGSQWEFDTGVSEAAAFRLGDGGFALQRYSGPDSWPDASWGDALLPYYGGLCLSNWIQRSPAAANDLGRGATDGVITCFVEQGSEAIQYTYDGITFTRVVVAGGATLHDIGYDGSTYWVAVGFGGEIYYTTDPTGSWTLNDQGSQGFNTVAYGNGYWVATVISTNTIYYATDPTGTWTANAAGTNYLYDCRYGNGYWVMVGLYDGVQYRASDPTGAFSNNSSGFGSITLNAVAYGVVNGVGTWIAAGASGALYTTSLVPSGTWTGRTSATGGTIDLTDIAFGNGAAVVVGDGNSTQIRGIQVTLNGVDFVNKPNSAGNFPLRGVVFVADHFIAVGDSGEIQTSLRMGELS